MIIVYDKWIGHRRFNDLDSSSNVSYAPSGIVFMDTIDFKSFRQYAYKSEIGVFFPVVP